MGASRSTSTKRLIERQTKKHKMYKNRSLFHEEKLVKLRPFVRVHLVMKVGDFCVIGASVASQDMALYLVERRHSFFPPSVCVCARAYMCLCGHCG